MMANNRIDILESILKEEPNDAFTLYALGLEYLNAGDEMKSLMLLEEVKKLHPEYLPVFYQLGKLYEMITRNKEAILCYQEGILLAQKLKNLRTLSELKQALSGLQDIED